MEMWRPVVNYEGSYEVSNYGKVRSLDSRHYHKEKTLKENKDGHMRVWLSQQSKKRGKFVHRLVAKAFIPNEFNKPVVNHIDGVPSNNKVDNLEWATRSENDLHAFRIGLRTPSCGGTSIPVLRIDQSGNEVIYKSLSDAGREFNKHPGQIHRYIKSDDWYDGYKWRLLDEGVTTIRKE